MKKNIISVAILLFSLYNAQSLNIKSPQSYEMERYGNVPVNLNVGGIDLSIPLFEQKFNSIGDFKLSLNYNSAGFIPNKKSNYVGQDWFLNFGGVISRTINGVADDSDVSENTFSSKGFLVGTRLGPKSNLDVYNGTYSTSYWKDHVSINGYQYELRPDKFSFNFMGISGYFYIGNNGIPIAVSEDMNLKVDVSNLANQQNYECAPQDSEIIITDGKGIKYYFGGNRNNLEISYQMGNSKDPAQFLPNGQGIFSINSWYLRKVEYPNNHVLEIEYLKYKKFDSDWEMPGLGNFCTITQPPQQSSFDFVEEFFDFNKYVNQRNQRFSYNYDTSMGGYHVWGDGSGFSYQAPYFQYTLTKKAFPSKIILDGKQLVGFNYTRFPSNDNNYQSLKLNSVEIKNQDVLVKKIDFSYYRNKDYFFLTAVTFPNNTKYTFDYYNKESLPKSTTLGIDFWGFWNGQDENSNYLIPKYSFNVDTGDYQVTGTSRNSNTSLVNTGLLKIVNYPTGGNSSFIYEPHTYSKKLERDFSSDFLPYIKSESGAVGGARISKIIDFDGVNTVTRDFKYIRNYGSGSAESSGIATQILRYMDYIDYKNVGSGRTQVLTETAQNISENSLSSSPISYSEVSELTNNILQKKHYFTDYSINPDVLIERNDVVGLDDVKPYKLTKNFFIRYNSNDNQRGKLLKTQMFNNGELVREIENTYTSLATHPLLLNRYFSRVQQYWPWIHYQKEFMNPYLLSSTTVKDYMNGNVMPTKTEYSYEGRHLNVTKEKINYPSGDIYETKYQYTTDILHGSPNQPASMVPPYAFLVNFFSKDLQGIPLVVSTYKNNKFLNRAQTLYEFAPNNDIYNITLPKKKLYYTEEKNVASQPLITLPDTNYGSLEFSYDKYDDKGNVLQYITKDGLSTVIIWGYNQTQPIAKIEGAKLTDIQQSLIDSIVNASNTDASAVPNADETVLLTALNTFRNSLSNYQVTTYTYDPLIGVRSITPPSGIRENYIYDSAGRLQKVIDVNGKLVKEMKYNYKN